MKNIYLLIQKHKGFVSYTLLVFLLICFSTIFIDAKAENIITSGTTLKVLSGTSLVSSESLTINNGATLDNAGTLILKKNLTNQNFSAFSIGGGTVVCSGTIAQALNGSNVIQNLTINNAAGVTNGGENQVNGILTLTTGLVTLGSNNFTLGSSATVSGGSATAMLVPTGTGEVRKSFNGIGSFTFPIGDNTGTSEYSPVTLTFLSGFFGAGNYTGIKLVNAIYPGSPAVNYIKRYWDISQSGINGFSSNLTFQYLPADVVGTESTINCLRITPTSVAYYSAANTVLHQLTANSLAYFGTFTGNQILAAKNLNLTVLLEGLYNGSGTMRKARNGSGDQYPGNTADQVKIEMHNSASYPSITYTLSNINLSTSGAVSASIPGIFNGSYYVTVRHRNSIETTTAAAVSFAANPINYNFTNLATKAYGSNMISLSGGYWAFYGGDYSQDGLIDGTDMAAIDNASTASLVGYITEDVNGDGLVDGSDMAIIDNNSTASIHAVLP